ncbi:hypothetical protein AAFC00_006465 [Neodothiora populina]
MLVRLSVWMMLMLLLESATAVFINFDNCLDPNIIISNPLQLQFIPLYVDARFDESAPNHNLNITVYGNVSGQAVVGNYPPATDPSWTNPNDTFGKILDVSPSNNHFSTLFQDFNVLTYSAYDANASQFCQSVVGGECPLAPSFSSLGGNYSDPYSLSAFSVGHNFHSSYAFATFAATLRVQSGDAGAPDLACISANITPALGGTLVGLLTYLPVAVLCFVAIGTAAAAVYSPWGSTDPFKWTTNYGRDEDLLRLVTPGFNDCLQYIQFIFLTGALTLNYPGFYQPATRNVAWSALLFNESFVSHGAGTQSLSDGIYFTNGTYGMTRMSQLIGMTAVRDTWACMAIWLVVLCAIAVVICQIGFLSRWLYRFLTSTSEEDLRSKNWPLSGGMVVRVIFNYFLLPVVSISMFQLVIAARSTAAVVACSVILLLAIIVFAGWILILIFRTKPRAYLFDDLPTVLLYGSLYNTYSDEAAPFALIPAVLTFMRGVAIGAVQPSGIAQIIVLAICEVVLILTLHAFKPFHSPTHMNAYHTFFAAARLAAILLSVAFVPSLGVTEGPKGWIGYAILLLHAAVLVFGFFINAIQTLIEVGARMAGAGGDPQHGAQRGGLISYSWRQLAKREPGKGRANSMTSDAAMLANDSDAKSLNLMGGTRSRSMSASSQMLLNQQLDPRSSGFDNFDQDYATSQGLETPGASNAAGSVIPGSASSVAGPTGAKRPILGIKTEQPLSDPYYRPPRARRNTNDILTPGAKSRHSGEWTKAPYMDSPAHSSKAGAERDSLEHDTPVPAYLRSHHRGASDTDLGDLPRERTDYAVREVDFYYGVRGPALSEGGPTRKLKTGPADPMGPVSNASSWFQRLFKGKSKETGKGFEVVRSSRMPPTMSRDQQGDRFGDDPDEGEELQTSPPMNYPPYRDSPEVGQSRQVSGGAERDVSDSPDVVRVRNPERRIPSGITTRLDGTWDPDSSDDQDSDDDEDAAREARRRSSPFSLPAIVRSGSFNLGDHHYQSVDAPTAASAAAAAAGGDGATMPTTIAPPAPSVPRKNSRRNSSAGTNTYIPHHPRFQNSLGGAEFEDLDRPTSMGTVSHRNTGDATVFQNVRAAHIGQGDSAEFISEEERAMSMRGDLESGLSRPPLQQQQQQEQ